MSFNYKRQEILSGIGFNTVIDSKFKTNTIAIKLLTNLNSETASLNSLAISVVGSANATYKTIPMFSQRLSELYGSSIGTDISKTGDVQIISLVAKFIDESYAFDGENLSELITDILIDCLFNPVVEDGAFNEELFNISKKELLDALESEINNKRSYAIMQSKNTIFKGEPASVLSYGDKEHTLKATAKECYENLKRLLSTCNIEIFYVGNTEKPFIMEKFKQAFSRIDRTPEVFPITTPSTAKPTVEEVTEAIDVNQAKMVMAFKTTHQVKHNNAIMNTILGMSPFSKLFTNVREKLSLCYYCQSNLDNLKKTIFIDCGIEVENFEKSKEAILQQIKDIQDGNFTTQDLDNAKKYLCNSLKGIGDTPSSYISWYFINTLIGNDRTIDDEYSKYLAVTKEDVIESARAMTLDTIYLLKPM